MKLGERELKTKNRCHLGHPQGPGVKSVEFMHEKARKIIGNQHLFQAKTISFPISSGEI
jgi:hypothetical protein